MVERGFRFAETVPDFEGIGRAIRGDEMGGESAEAGAILAMVGIVAEHQFARDCRGLVEIRFANQDIQVDARQLGRIAEPIGSTTGIHAVGQLEEGSGVVVDQCGGAAGPGPEAIGVEAAEIEIGEGPGGKVQMIEAGSFEEVAFGGGEIAGAFGGEAAVY